MFILKTLDYAITKYLMEYESGFKKTRDVEKAMTFKDELSAKIFRNNLLNGEKYSIIKNPN